MDSSPAVTAGAEHVSPLALSVHTVRTEPVEAPANSLRVWADQRSFPAAMSVASSPAPSAKALVLEQQSRSSAAMRLAGCFLSTSTFVDGMRRATCLSVATRRPTLRSDPRRFVRPPARSAAMSDRNRFGLSRTIPSSVRREVRQRCGYGCVRCGLALYDYEHFDPEFKDADAHVANGITLLCMQCNQKKRRGMLSAESVRGANLAPRCLQQGYASEIFDFGPNSLTVAFAGVTFTDTPKLIVVNDIPILAVKPPEAPHQPFLLSGFF